MKGSSSRPLGWGFFGLLALAALAFDAVYALHVVSWRSAPDRGWLMTTEGEPGVVAALRPNGEAAGLRVGDRILAVNAGSFETRAELMALLDLEVGHRNRYTIQRGEEVVELSVETRPHALRTLVLEYGTSLAVGFLFLALGVLVFLMKPFEAASWAFFLIAAFAGVLLPYLRVGPRFEPPWLDGVFIAAAYLWGAALFHLTAFFPERRRRLADHPAWIPSVYGAAIVLSVAELSGEYLTASRVSAVRWLLVLSGLLALLGSTLEVSLRSRSAVARVRALAVLTGAALAGLVPAADSLYTLAVGVRFLPYPTVVLQLFVIAFPAAIGYAIVRHDLFEIDVIIRRTYGYLLSTALVILLYGATVSTLNLLVGPSEIARSPFFTVAFVLAVVFLMQPLQGRIQRVVDRAFYRQQYDYRQTISEVTDRMTQLLEPALVRETLVSSVVGAMFLENGRLLVPTEGERRFEVAMATGAGAGAGAEVGLDKALWEALVERRVPVFRHEIELAPHYAAYREEMLASFDALGAELMLPMLYQGELRAVLSLGRKKSGKMFTREDVDLLRTLVAEGAVALENARLFDDLAGSLQQVQLLETIKQGLSKFVPKTVQDLIAESPDASGIFEKREKDLSVMFADMTGYTRLSAQLPLDEVNAIVERYFGAFLNEIVSQGGDVNETAGDGLMVLFQTEDPLEHARAAVRAALGIQRVTREINAEREGQIPIGVHIGINSGIASVGATKIQGGGGMRWTYTASGPTTNVSARIGALGEEIAITKGTLERLGGEFVVEAIGEKTLKNVKEPVPVFRVTGVTGSAEAMPAESEPAAGLEIRRATPLEAGGSGRFVVTGIVSERESGRPLGELWVRAYDKDLLSDDYLGSSRTDAQGRFEIRFTDESFSDLFERHPDIYLRIFEATGSSELYDTRDAVRWNAGAVEQLDVAIPRARLA